MPSAASDFVADPATACVRPVSSRTASSAAWLLLRLVTCRIGGQCGDEGLLGYLDPADRLHPLLAFLLLLEQFALTGDVTAVALAQHVLADGPDVLAGNDSRADRGLDRHLELLTRD